MNSDYSIGNSIIDIVYAILFALLPIIQPLRSIFPVTLSMMAIILAVPYVVIKLIQKHTISFSYMSMVILYYLYCLVNGNQSIQEVGVSVFVIFYILLGFNGGLNGKVFFRTVEILSLCATIIIIIQTLCHYLFGFHLQALPTALRPELTGYYYAIKTGYSGSLYRPSAFFLEPAAMTMYLLFPLIINLFGDVSNGNSLIKASFLSVGIVLTTSGMGVVLVIGTWLLFVVKTYHRKGQISLKLIILMFIMIISVIIAYLSIGMIRNTINRIFFAGVTSETSNNAILGRIGSGEYYISQLTTKQLIFGSGVSIDEYTMYLSGYYYIILKNGLIGYILYCCIYLRIFHLLDFSHRLLALLLIIIPIFSNICYIHSLLFFYTALLSAWDLSKANPKVLLVV